MKKKDLIKTSRLNLGVVFFTGVMAILGFLFFVFVVRAEPSSYFEKFTTFEEAVENNRHEEIVKLASELTEITPEDPTVWYFLGRSAFILEQHNRAIKSSQRAWELGYHFMPWIALRIAGSAAVLGQEEQVKLWLERALSQGLEDRQSIAEYSQFQAYLDQPWFRTLAALDSPATRLEGLSSDIDLIVSEARRLHPGYSRVSTEFEEAANTFKKSLANLNDRQVLYGLMKLVARLNDGHSVVYGPTADSPLEISGTHLPVLFYMFEEGLYIVAGHDEGASLIGRRVERIGNRTPKELLEYSRRLHGAENSMTMVWLGVHFYFPRVDFLIEAGAIDNPEKVTLVLATEKEKRAELFPGSYEFRRKLRPQGEVNEKTPLYLRRVEDNYWFKVLEDKKTLYFQFNQVRNFKDEPLSALSGRLGMALSNPEIKTLIIDVRHNNGGNNGLLTPLIRQIVAFDTKPNKKIFVITGRNTFSAAQNFINRLNRFTDAIFVGEPSSSKPNFIGEETELILPWSKVLVSISSRWWQDSDPGDERPWIAPKIPVAPRADDYFSGRDAALEAIMKVINKK